MDGGEMLLALGCIDDTLIAEAAQEKTLKGRTHPARWIALAASMIVVLAAAASLPALFHPPIETEAAPNIVPATDSTAGNGSAQTDPSGMQPVDESVPLEAGASAAIRIDRDNIHVNQAETLDGAIKLDDYSQNEWDEDDIRAYFGRDLIPAYLPAGLTPDENNGTACVYQKADGTLVYDTVTVKYGSVHPTGEANAPKGFMLLASKLGPFSDYIFVLPGEDEIRTTDIAGTAVTIGYREMTYGPYDPETHAPSGTYPLYVFQFILDGVEYDITTHNLPLDEGVKITASFITGSAKIEIVD